MVTLVAKKQAKTDRRSERYKGITIAEARAAADKIGKVAGSIISLCDEADELLIEGFNVGGRSAILDAVETLTAFAKVAKGIIEGEKMDI